MAGKLGAHPVVWTFFSVMKITGLILFCFPPFVIHTGERRTINSTRNICTTDRLIHSTPFISTCVFCPLYFLFTTSSTTCVFLYVICSGELKFECWSGVLRKVGRLFSPSVQSVHINHHHSHQHSSSLVFKPIFPFLFNLLSLA